MAGIMGLRLDIFLIVWFLSMGMVNYLEGQTGFFGFHREPKYNITAIAGWQGVAIGSEASTGSAFMNPGANTDENSYGLLDTFMYLYRAGSFVLGVLWNASFGFHTYLLNTFGVPYLPWGIPLMVLINLMNFLGLIELWGKVHI